jgi:hypothetical protein
MIVGDDKPSLEELYHYGVMGMKWGQRKKATGADIYKARRQVNAYRTVRAIATQRRNESAAGSKERDRMEKTLERIEKDYEKDPARAIAVRMTRGEKFAAGLLALPTGGLSLASIVVSSAASRRIEYKQDKKK